MPMLILESSVDGEVLSPNTEVRSLCLTLLFSECPSVLLIMFILADLAVFALWNRSTGLWFQVTSRIVKYEKTRMV